MSFEDYFEEILNDVLDRNKMIEVDAITDPSLITTTSASATTFEYDELNEYEKELIKNIIKRKKLRV